MVVTSVAQVTTHRNRQDRDHQNTRRKEALEICSIHSALTSIYHESDPGDFQPIKDSTSTTGTSLRAKSGTNITVI